MAKKIKYTEPDGYMPKEIRDKFFKKTASKGTSSKKTTKKSK